MLPLKEGRPFKMPGSDTPENREPHERGARPCHDARRLTANGAVAELVLDGQRYVLRITRQGKLILSK